MSIRVLELVTILLKKDGASSPEDNYEQRDEPQHPTKLNFGPNFVGTNALEKMAKTVKISETQTFILLKVVSFRKSTLFSSSMIISQIYNVCGRIWLARKYEMCVM